MEAIKLDIGKDFSPIVGARYKSLGPYSGEAFYEEKLLPKFNEAKENGVKLVVYMDGVKSYSSSFLDESFGKLAREKGLDNVKSILVLCQETKQFYVDYINDEIWSKI